MKSKLLSLILVVILLCVITTAMAADARYEQTVPFGIAHRDDGCDIGVYTKAGNTKAAASLADYTLCSIIGTQDVSGTTWFQISYFDTAMMEQKGYVKGEDFYQLTVAGLVTVASDPDTAAYLQAFSGISDSQMMVAAQPFVITQSAAATDTATEKQVTYVLNKNTKKFHYPWCDSVDDIKAKNRQDFYGERNEIPSGYKPCKKCNP